MADQTTINRRAPVASAATRRQLLFSLAAASTAAIGAAAGASPRAEVQAENPMLLRLADELATVDAEHDAAIEARRKIVAETRKIWPLAPEEIFGGGSHGDLERDVTGGALIRPGENEPKNIGKPEGFAYWQGVARHALQKKSRARSERGVRERERFNAYWREELRKAERAEPLSVAYWAECERIQEASGYRSAQLRETAACKKLKALVAAILAEQEETMLGVIIKAQALAAWNKADVLWRALNVEGVDWGGQMAAAVMRQASQSAGTAERLAGRSAA